MLSTIHTGKLVSSGKKFRNTQDPVFKPEVIVYYNRKMGGVDLLSRVLISYSCQMRGLKWYRKLAELFLDVTLYNSFIAWSNLNPFTKMTHLTFRKKLITEIITFHSSGSKLPPTGPKTTVDNLLRLRKIILIFIPELRRKHSRKLSVLFAMSIRPVLIQGIGAQTAESDCVLKTFLKSLPYSTWLLKER